MNRDQDHLIITSEEYDAISSDEGVPAERPEGAADLVARLRAEAADWKVGTCVSQAADMIEALVAENDRLKGAAEPASAPNVCDCERGHNGLGISARVCDCGPESEGTISDSRLRLIARDEYWPRRAETIAMAREIESLRRKGSS